jgi:lipoate-protein ligase A
VEWDLIDRSGNKIAGAGQRRTRKGLLHQGSILLGEPTDDAAVLMRLASELALSVEVIEMNPSGEGLTALVSQFSEPAWLNRR